MKTSAKLLIIAGVAIAAAAVFLLKHQSARSGAGTRVNALEIAAVSHSSALGAGRPKLIDVGAGKCIPCKLMAPILEELKRECTGRLDVEFLDALQDPAVADRYGVEIIPTQIFYFIYYSSLVNPDAALEETKVQVTDWISGRLVAATSAQFLYGVGANGRPQIQAFASEPTLSGDSPALSVARLSWHQLRTKELATRCAFCDRAVYPEDGNAVRTGGAHLWACCPMCGLGVAARLQKDIEVEAKDPASGEIIRVQTFQGKLAAVHPPAAWAWAGRKKRADGTIVSAGCFKQAWFASAENLRAWLESHPAAAGAQVTLAEALSEKMKLTPQQIAGACKLGECK